MTFTRNLQPSLIKSIPLFAEVLAPGDLFRHNEDVWIMARGGCAVRLKDGLLEDLTGVAVCQVEVSPLIYRVIS
jgi:hypothetical protein